jgi:hypothetical protein
MLSGPPGVGKTQIIRDAISALELRLKYFSAPTLDPWADFVGIPMPTLRETDGGMKHRLEFIRPADVEHAEVMFFDELNRSHPKVQNAVMELVQFRAINGVHMHNLKCVVAAINPTDGSARLSELDCALTDRFDIHLEVHAEPDAAYLTDRSGIAPKTAAALVEWWQHDLTADLRKQISPRRLEKLAVLYAAGIALDAGLPPQVKAPMSSLKKRLNGANPLPFPLTPDSMVQKQKELIHASQNSLDVALAVAERLWAWPALAKEVVPLLLVLPSDVQASLLENTEIRSSMKEFTLVGEPADLREQVFSMVTKVA